MSHRIFRAADGSEWQVWNVIPGAWRAGSWSGPEHRFVERRSPEPVLRYTGPERRQSDRRGSSCLVSPELSRGWLTFQNGNERRRLTPIPRDWESLPDPELARLCDAAERVSGRSAG
jgi:hypothetical protein